MKEDKVFLGEAVGVRGFKSHPPHLRKICLIIECHFVTMAKVQVF